MSVILLGEFLPLGLGLVLEKPPVSWTEKLTSSPGSEIFLQ